MTDFLGKKRAEIINRMNELKPAVDEFTRLQEADRALASVIGAAAATASPNGRRRPGRLAGSKASATSATNASKATAKAAGKPVARKKRAGAKATGRRGGRRKGTGARATQALQVIVDKPGAEIPEIAKEIGIKTNYLYRVLPGMKKEGLVTKKGRGWHPTKVAA